MNIIIPPKINFVNGLCGSGKTTTRLIPNVVKAVNDNLKVCVVVPSTELQTQIQNDLLAYNINAEVINSDSTTKVTNSILRIFGPLSYQYDGRVIIITHAAYKLVIPDLDTTEWVFHCDELPPATDSLMYEKNKERMEYADHTEFMDIDPETDLCTLKPSFPKTVRLNAMSNELRTIFSALKSPHTEMYLDNDNSYGASFITVYKPSFHAHDITFYGANSDFSLLYKIMKHFNPNITMDTLPNKNNNHNSSRIKIHYSTNVHLSKYLQETNSEGFRQIYAPLIDKIGKNNCLLLCNDISAELEEFKKPNILKISHNAHGLNNLDHFHHVMLISALNRSDRYVKVMKKFGITELDILLACTIEIYYQIAMRTAIRKNEELTEDVHIYTPNHIIASMLKEYAFPNAELIKVADVVIKRKTKKVSTAMSGGDRIKLARMRKIAKTNPEYYPKYVIKALTTFTGSRSKEIVSLPWFTNYNSSGNLK